VRRSVPVVVALLAVLGLLAPPATVCHAHEGGHDAHAHDAVRTVHVPLPHSHGHGPVHTHPHSETPDLPEDAPADRDAPKSHVHAADGVEAIAHSTGDLTARSMAGLAESPFACVVSWAVPEAEPRGPVPRAQGPWPCCSRPKDRLVLLGSLLF
jgi:hypothetical protein